MYFSFKFRIPTGVSVAYVQIIFSKKFELKNTFPIRTLTFLHCYRSRFLLAAESSC
jgi:hypothetical protein